MLSPTIRSSSRPGATVIAGLQAAAVHRCSHRGGAQSVGGRRSTLHRDGETHSWKGYTIGDPRQPRTTKYPWRRRREVGLSLYEKAVKAGDTTVASIKVSAQGLETDDPGRAVKLRQLDDLPKSGEGLVITRKTAGSLSGNMKGSLCANSNDPLFPTCGGAPPLSLDDVRRPG